MIKHRNKCVICQHPILVDCYTFKEFPINMGTDPVNDYHYQDMEWVSCDKCGELQLKTLIDESVLYGKTHNGSVGKSWVEHNNTFVDFIASECYGNVLEIGGGNLHIANKIAESDKVNNYHIIDSNIFKENATTYKFNFSEDLFDLNTIPDKSYDFIIHSHTLEHLYEPALELKQLNRVLKSNGKMFFSVPLINNMLKQGYTNALNFEHTFYLNEDLIRTLLINTGFDIDRSDYFSTNAITNWCFFVSCSVCKPSNNIIDKNLNIVKEFKNFIKLQNDIVLTINKELEKYINSDIFIFGAHIFTQFLLNFGLKTNFINVLDNDINKQGEFLYGTNLVVESPKILSEYKNPVVVLKAGQFNNEIKQDILENINNKTLFLE